MASAGPVCRRCGAVWTGGKPEFRAVCGACGSWMHACLNCRHHDPAAHHECRASAGAEFAADKEKFNYCEEFAFRAGPPDGPAAGRKSRAEIEKLFQ